MKVEDDRDQEALGVIGHMSRRLAREREFWRIVCALNLPPSEVDKWPLRDIRLCNAYLDMQSDYKRAFPVMYDILREEGDK